MGVDKETEDGKMQVKSNLDKETGDDETEEKQKETEDWHAFVDQCVHIEFNQQSNQTEEDLEVLTLLNENPELLQLDKVAGYSKTK